MATRLSYERKQIQVKQEEHQVEWQWLSERKILKNILCLDRKQEEHGFEEIVPNPANALPLSKARDVMQNLEVQNQQEGVKANILQ